MAEGLLKKYAKDEFDIFSAGLEPKEINPLTLKVLKEAGVNTEGLYSKPLSAFLGKVTFSYLITVCGNAEEKCPIFPGMGFRMHWPFEDPAAFEGSETERLEKFREIRNQIEKRILMWLDDYGKYLK